jgi:hypothetical protein
VRFQRSDGLPDECGDPPPPPPVPPPPGWNGPTVINISYTNNEGDTVNIAPTLTFGYIDIDVNADLEIPITLNLDFNNDFNFDFDIEGRISMDNSREINFNFGGDDFDFRPPPTRRPDDSIELPPPPPGTPSPPPNDNEPPAPPPVNDIDDVIPPPVNDPDWLPDDPPPPPESYEIIIGVRVITTQIGDTPITRLQQGVNPDVHIPDLGLVQFLVRTGERSAGWTTDIRVKNGNQVIPCPWPNGAIDVRGTPRAGVQWELRPIKDKRVRQPEYPPPVTIN